MDTTESARLLAAANGATALLDRLDLAALPELASLHVSTNHRDRWRIGVMAQLDSYGLSQLESIDAVRTWAVAVGGALRLDEQDTGEQDKPRRYLAAVTDLPDGSLFEIWTCLHREPAA
ncbi:MAG TPA: hypothetical protein VHF26_14095 [Trebonia sp.]|nr:hypothetical protein [Trebonia sp.]